MIEAIDRVDTLAYSELCIVCGMRQLVHNQCKKLEVPGYLRDQLLRASSSVVLNLAEGSGKPYYRDRKRFYAIAFGSVREVQAILDLLDPCYEQEQAIRLVESLAGCVYRLVFSKSLNGKRLTVTANR